MQMRDAELLARSLRGDESAFQTLYERHVGAVFRFAWLLTKSHTDAEDLAQECFLILMRKAAAFDPEKAQLRTWMLGVTRHLCLQHRQRNQRLRQLGSESPTCQETAEKSLIRNEVELAVRRAVEELPEAQREAVFLFELEGLSLKDVSSVLNIEVNAVKARLYRGREQLKRSLAASRELAKE